MANLDTKGLFASTLALFNFGLDSLNKTARFWIIALRFILVNSRQFSSILVNSRQFSSVLVNSRQFSSILVNGRQ